MTWRGRIVGGTVVLDGPPPPEGAEVTIQLSESTEKPQQPLSELLLSFAGIAPGLPPDMAENHDHYLYGAPKRG